MKIKSERVCGIYGIKATNNKWYIGQSINILARWKDYIKNFKKDKCHNIYLERYVNKYGWQNLKFFILIECSKFELNYHEKNLIKEYDSFHNGFNLTSGGTDGHNNGKSYVIKNFVTGEIISFKNLRKFCQENDYSEGSIRNLVGHQSDWTGQFCRVDGNGPIKYKFVDPKGVIHETYSIRKFANDNDLWDSELGQLWLGHRDMCKGWRKYEEGVVYNPYYNFQLVSPDGELINISTSIKKFSEESSLNDGLICGVLNGCRPHHQGWRKYIGPESLIPFAETGLTFKRKYRK